jgi:hypothetical protein
MPDLEARASVSVPGRSLRPGRSPPALGRGHSFGPVRDGVGDRYRRGRSRACGRELLIVARLACSDRGQAPHVKEAPQVVVTGWVMRSIYRLVVLAKELRARVRGGLSGLPADRRGLPSAVRSRDSAYAHLPSSARPPCRRGHRRCGTGSGHLARIHRIRRCHLDPVPGLSREQDLIS